MDIKRGSVVIVDLDPVRGSEQGKMRPAVVIQNDIGNRYSSTTIIAPITSKIFEKKYPTIIEINKKESGLKNYSTVLLNQIRTIDKSRIKKTCGKLNKFIMDRINNAIKISLDLA